jgi:hypothetical protein
VMGYCPKVYLLISAKHSPLPHISPSSGGVYR